MITHNASRSFWQMNVPCEALHCNYLLSAILALSTLHRAHLLRSTASVLTYANLESAINQSLHLHQASVSQFTASVSSITRQNIVPAIAQASLSSAYSCALAQLLPTLTPTDHVDQVISVITSIYKALRLFRGHTTWLGSTGIEIEDRDGPDMVEKRGKKNGVELALKARKLRAINLLSCDTDDERTVYDAAITAFLDIHAHWTMKIPSKYMDLLQQKRPMALLVLHVFVLEGVEDGTEAVPWFMVVWKEGLSDYVQDYLGLLWTQYCELGVRYEFFAHNLYNDTNWIEEATSGDSQALNINAKNAASVPYNGNME